MRIVGVHKGLSHCRVGVIRQVLVTDCGRSEMIRMDRFERL